MLSPTQGNEAKAAIPWHNSAWPYRKKITIDNTKVSGSTDLTNFPVLVNRTDADWKHTSNGGRVAQTDGGDILFTSSDGTTKLDHEIETYATSTGQLIAHVEIPTLGATADTDVYIYYGNASAADQWNINGTWNADYKGVWHLKETTGGSSAIKDSTSNANHGTDTNAPTLNATGQVDGAITFDGSDDYVPVTNNIDFSGTFSISMWVYRTAATKQETLFSRANYCSSSTRQWDAAQVYVLTGGSLGYSVQSTTDCGSGAQGDWYEGDLISTNQWQHVVMVVQNNNQASRTVTGYINGQNANLGVAFNGSPTFTQDSNQRTVIGAADDDAGNAEEEFTGLIDDVRVSNVALSADWITTEYNNQSSPSTFYSIASEELGSGFTQSAYRFYDNTNGTNVGTPLAGLNTGATAPTQGTPFRLRLALHVATSTLPQSGQDFKLQSAQKSGSCDTSFSGESYSDLSPSSGLIRFYDNTSVSDGAALTATSTDPTHGADTVVNQTYEEANNFTNSQAAISAGQDGLWDFALVDNSAQANASYCFRAVKSDGTTLDTYSVIPEIATASPTVQFTATSSSGSESVTSVTLSLSSSLASSVDVTVDYTVSGTATGGGTDYTLANGTATIPAGNSTTTIALTIVNDTLDESDETVIVTLSNPSNATLGTNTTHTYTITDNDDPPTVAFSSATSSGGEATTPATLTVTLSTASGKTITVDYAATGGTASGSGTDYTLASGTLTFTANATSTALSITIVNDTLDEADETITVTLSNPSNATLGANATHTYTITDNDDAPTVAFSTLSANGSEATSPVTLTISLSATSNKTITVDYAATGGTATGSGTDYTLASGTLTFTSADTSEDISVSIINDTTDENDETVIITLSNPSNTTLGTNTTHTYTYTITDNDEASGGGGDTAAPVISSVSASAGDTTAAITWTSNENASSKVEYGLTSLYGSSTTEADTSPRVTSHSVSLSGLTACSTYHYRVTSKDASLNEGVNSDNSFTTTCPGGALPPGLYSTPLPPLGGFRILINKGEPTTKNRIVTLSLEGGPSVNRMAISNFPDFSNAGIEPFSSEKQWTLLQGNGTKTVYARFYTQGGQSSPVVSDSILLHNSPSEIKSGDLIGGPDGIRVYVINDQNYKRHIVSPEVFSFYPHLKWESIKSVSSETLSSFKTSWLYREKDDYRVFIIQESKNPAARFEKRWLKVTPSQFTFLGYDWKQVFMVNKSELRYYPEGSAVTGNALTNK